MQVSCTGVKFSCASKLPNDWTQPFGERGKLRKQDPSGNLLYYVLLLSGCYILTSRFDLLTPFYSKREHNLVQAIFILMSNPGVSERINTDPEHDCVQKRQRPFWNWETWILFKWCIVQTFIRWQYEKWFSCLCCQVVWFNEIGRGWQWVFL